MGDHVLKEVCEKEHRRVDEIMAEIKDTQETQGVRIDGLTGEVRGLSKEVAILTVRIDDLPDKITGAVKAAFPRTVKTEWTPKGIVTMCIKLWPLILALLAAAGVGYGIGPRSPDAAPVGQVESAPASTAPEGLDE